MHLDMAAQKERDDQEKMIENSVKREEDFQKLASENEALKAELTKVKSRYKVNVLKNLSSPILQFMTNAAQLSFGHHYCGRGHGKKFLFFFFFFFFFGPNPEGS